IWKYGKPPEIAIEIVSNLKGHEAGGKMSDYAQAGVRYYAIFDPEQYLHKRILRLYELHGAGYIEMVRQQFPEIGLGLTVWNGVYIEREDTWLRWCDRNGKLIATGIESNALKDQRAEREKQRAEQRAEQEKREKQQAEQSVARLKEKLREMGIDPKEI
ncbi:MAG: Uma2 family endonuclease, partial [Gammaproteobacteria bacterium]|nr:Uma2 family endonuclease [Gammaproteobacteria bacterium]